MSPLLIASAALAVGTQGAFVERAEELGLHHLHASGLDRVGIGTEMLDWVQSGIALGDVNGDGGLDVVCAGGLLPVHLFLRSGGAWVDATEPSGLASSELFRAPALGDYDLDGDLDLFLGSLDAGDGPTAPRSRLYRNGGAGVFEDVTALAGTVGNGHSVHARWTDVDLDGLLDLVTAEFHGTPNRLYLNHGDGTFADVSETWGFDDGGSAHVVGVADADGDGRLDAFVANDFTVSASMGLSSNAPNAHLAGLPGGGFLDVSLGSGYGLKLTTMGLSFGDVDYDGDLDVYQTEYGANLLQINRGWPGSGDPWIDQAFEYRVACEVAAHAGSVGHGDLGLAVGWGAALRHLDHDPWLDLVVVNGHVATADPVGQQNVAYRGRGPDFDFAFLETTSSWGLLDFVDDRALAVGDPDLDGDLDLFVGGVSSRLRYYENRLDRNGQGGIRVEALCRTSAPGGAGTVVSWTDAEGYPHVRPLGADAPTASQNELAVFLGLGPEPAADVTVAFPSGILRTYEDVPRDSTLVAEEPRLFELPFRTARVSDSGETFTVAAFAHDAGGQPLGAGAQVDLEVEGLSPVGPVQHAGGTRFEREFAVPSAPGAHRVTARFDGFEVLVRPRLLFAERLSFQGSTARFAPECVRAGTADVATLTFVPRSRVGTALGPGLRVVASLAGESVALRDEGDGRYTAAFAAPGQPGTYPLDLRLLAPGSPAPIPLAGAGALEVAGPAYPGATELYLEVPDLGIAAEPQRLKGLVTFRDVTGRRLGPGAAVEIEVVPAPGSASVALLPAPSGAQEDGEHFFVLESAALGAAAGELRFTVDGVAAGGFPFEF